MAPKLTVSDFIAITNQTLEYAYPVVEIEGEVASFKVNQGKFVFFDLKDAGASVGCFMMLFQLRVPIEDGMKVVVTASPKLTQWGKFSLTVKAIRPSGEGSLKKSFELLHAKLDAEGLFADERKRPLPTIPRHIAVISSPQAAGYADFIKILNDRWGGMRVDVAAVTVQGADAPDQIIRALNYFNTQEELPEVIAIIRGGGSADDLSAFNDEQLVRAIAASRIPTITGVGHEVDTSLSDLAADVRAATPSNAAQIIVPDRRDMIRSVRLRVQSVVPRVSNIVEQLRQQLEGRLLSATDASERQLEQHRLALLQTKRLLAQLDPARVLERGYALLRGELKEGGTVDIETSRAIMKARIEHYEQK
ncbi:MAG: putative Exodeoxyribonuclease 7 large subunit [Candidatus Saccharibacteria bacterium]|nr:putative Exodeoxyribonuclease 7 large subunit [Candidatus Saccharibacteria bacterium]